MDMKLIYKLQKVRDAVGRPMPITSGYRCPTHNTSIGGVQNSSHTKGLAADISCTTSTGRGQLLAPISQQFDRVGIADTFIHADIDLTKPMPSVWLYPSISTHIA